MEKKIENCKVILKNNHGGLKELVNKQQRLKSSQDVKKALFSKPEYVSEVKKIRMNRRPSKLYKLHKHEKQRDFKDSSGSSEFATITCKMTGVVEKQIYQPTVENGSELISTESHEAPEKCSKSTEGDFIPNEDQDLKQNSIDSTVKEDGTLSKSKPLLFSENGHSYISVDNQQNIERTSLQLTCPSNSLTPSSTWQQYDEETAQPLHSTPNHHNGIIYFDAKNQFEKDILVQEVQTGKQTIVACSCNESLTGGLDNNTGQGEQASTEKKCQRPVSNDKLCTKNVSNRSNEQFEYTDILGFSRPQENSKEQCDEEFRVAEIYRLKPVYSPTDQTVSTTELGQNEGMFIAKPLSSQPCITSSSQFFSPVCSFNLQSHQQNVPYSHVHDTSQKIRDPCNKFWLEEEYDLQNKAIDTNMLDAVSQIVINVNTQKFIENIDMFKLLLSKVQANDRNSHASVGNPNVVEQEAGNTNETNQIASMKFSDTNSINHLSNKLIEGNPKLLQELLDQSLGNKYSTCQTAHTTHKDHERPPYLSKLSTYGKMEIPDSTHLISTDNSIRRREGLFVTSNSNGSDEIFKFPKKSSSFKRCETDIALEAFQDIDDGQRLMECSEGEKIHQSLNKYEIYIDLCPDGIDTCDTSQDLAHTYNYVILPDADDLVSSIDITDDNTAVLSCSNDSEEIIQFEDRIRKNLSSLDTSFRRESQVMSFSAIDDPRISYTNTIYTDSSNEIVYENERKTKSVDTDLDRGTVPRFKNICSSTVSTGRFRKKRHHHVSGKQRTGAQKGICHRNTCTLGKKQFDSSSGLGIDTCTNALENTRKRYGRKVKERNKPYDLRQRIIQKEHSHCNSYTECISNKPAPKTFDRRRRESQADVAKNCSNYIDFSSIDEIKYDLIKRKYENCFETPETSLSEDDNRYTTLDSNSYVSIKIDDNIQHAKHSEKSFSKSKQVSLAGKIKMPFRKKKKRKLNQGDELVKLKLYSYNTKTKPSNIRDMNDTNCEETESRLAKMSINSTNKQLAEDYGQTNQSGLTKPSANGKKRSRNMDICLLCGKKYSRPYIFIHRKRCASAQLAPKVDKIKDMNKTNSEKTEECVAKMSIDSSEKQPDEKTNQSGLTKPSGNGQKQSRTMDMCLLCGKRYTRPYIYIHRKRCASAQQSPKVRHRDKPYNKCVRKYPRISASRYRVSKDRRVLRSEGQKDKNMDDNLATTALREHFKKTQPTWKILKCLQCNYMTGYAQSLQIHCKVHSEQDHITCKHCKVSFRSPGRMIQWHRRYKIRHQRVTAQMNSGQISHSRETRIVKGKKEFEGSTEGFKKGVCSFMKDIKSLKTRNCQTMVNKISDKVGSKVLLKEKESSVLYERQETGEFKKLEKSYGLSDVKSANLCEENVSQITARDNITENVDSKISYESQHISSLSSDKQKAILNCIEKTSVFEGHGNHNMEMGGVLSNVSTVTERLDHEGNLLTDKGSDVEISHTEEDSHDKDMEKSNTLNAALETSQSNSTQHSEYEECMDGTERHITRNNSRGANQDKDPGKNSVKTRASTSGSIGQADSKDGDDEKDKDDKDDNKNTSDGASIRDVEFFSCLVCATSFSKKEELMRHLSKIHRLTNLCTLCYFKRLVIQRFSNAVSLRNHKLRDHAEDMVECVCGSLFIDEKMLTSHLKKFKCYSRTSTTTQQDMVKCICGKRFENDDLMLYHKRNKCRKRSSGISEEYDQKRDPKFTNDNMCDNICANQISKRPKCETISYEDSLLDSNVDRVEFTNEPASDRVAKSRISDKTSYVCNEEFKKSVEPVRVTLKQFTEDLNNNNIMDTNEIESKVDLNMNIVSGHAKSIETKFANSNKTVDAVKDNSKDSPNIKEINIDSVDVGKNKITEASQKLPKATSKAGIKSEKLAKNKDKTTKKAGRKSKPDAEGRYPCKTCGRRFKRPYLYVHQKQVHQPRQWMWVPKYDPSLKRYKCGLCNLVSIYWRTMVHHHYKKHPDMEFSVFPILPGSSTDSASLNC